MTTRDQKRRLCIVGGVFGLAVLVLWLRLFQVQYLRHDEYSRVAEKQRIAPRELAADRGGIFDRDGRPLAMNIRRSSVAVQPGRIKDAGAVAKSLAKELGVSARSVRDKLKTRKPFVYVKHDVMLTEATRRELAKIDGVVVELKANRIYPYDAVGSKVVGFVSRANAGLSGVEAAYDQALRGTPGRETVVRNGAYKSERYYQFVDKKPVDGKHVYLTIDATVQDVAETELKRAVDEFGARGGAVIVMEIATGDVLALAELPAISNRERAPRADSLWTLRSVSHIYEPGSTFKLVTVAALLDKTSVTPADSFDAEDGKAQVGVATIRDPHPHRWLTIDEAFMYSSNIVMAKASSALQPGDLYGYARLFGFGSKTGIGLPGESAGLVPPIERWSARTKQTMAFGQEVAVTPIQILNAFAAVANDGLMMMPRLVRGVADPATGRVSRSEPVVVRRVVSSETAATLREMCLRVVEDGTAQAARLEFMRVAGKTGTAQKAGGRGYLAHRYVSSFVGFAPYENPKIAAIVMIDEPKWASRFGGDSAAPVFARICRGLATSTSWFDDVLSLETLHVTSLGGRGIETPNFLRMDREAALESARRLGANVLLSGDGGRVVAQVPVPGTPMDKDGVVRLYVAEAGGATRPARAGIETNGRLRTMYRQAVEGRDDEPEPSESTRDVNTRLSKTASMAGVVAASAGSQRLSGATKTRAGRGRR
jgi:cell division protein FtsI/penicillin-binding protein 2